MAFVLFDQPQIEGLSTNEAIGNVASIYNKGNMKVSNLEATSKITSPIINSINSKIDSKTKSLDSKIKSLESTSANKSKTSCKTVYGSYQLAKGKNLHYLDRHRVYCGSNEFMNGFKVNLRGTSKECKKDKCIRFELKCCKFT